MEVPKIFALYLPQYHRIKENDDWWGEGFTDWVNVKNAKPLFPMHHQPRIPKNNNYYDLSRAETIREQVKLAKRYLISGFCIYHYWFDGKKLLHKPAELLLKNKDIDFPFCFAWANESWSKRWEGNDLVILQKQTHEPKYEKWEEHFLYLKDFWKDPRYFKIQGKPVFLIYKPDIINEIEEMILYWKKRSREEGFNGLYLIAMKSYELPDERVLEKFDAVQLFQPLETVNSFRFKGLEANLHSKIRYLPEPFLNLLRSLRYKTARGFREYDYDKVFQSLLEAPSYSTKATFNTAFMEWDNTARYKNKSTIYKGCKPIRFKYWLTRLIQKEMSSKNDEKLIFINAWNEWAEGTYLEPDEKNGHAYLQVVRECLEEASSH